MLQKDSDFHISLYISPYIKTKFIHGKIEEKKRRIKKKQSSAKEIFQGYSHSYSGFDSTIVLGLQKRNVIFRIHY